MKCKFKPTFNFQSVEYDEEVDLTNEESKKQAEEHYRLLLGILVRAAADVIQEEKEPLATDRQKEIMRTHDIKFTAKTTQKEASALIEASLKKSKNKK